MQSIKVGSYEILESGCVTSFNNGDTVFTLTEGMVVRLCFVTTEDGKQDMSADMNEKKELQINIQNFNNPLGTEFIEPIEIGNYNGRKLFLHIKIIGMQNNNNKTIIHTWYLGDNISNGEPNSATENK
ncbi:MAG: hypothetical protein K5864_02285 [Bacteroidales bacterium]|nr:hypothetical protein [Bacteroidales bacterium]